jgi:hypothetical protein
MHLPRDDRVRPIPSLFEKVPPPDLTFVLFDEISELANRGWAEFFSPRRGLGCLLLSFAGTLAVVTPKHTNVAVLDIPDEAININVVAGQIGRGVVCSKGSGTSGSDWRPT